MSQVQKLLQFVSFRSALQYPPNSIHSIDEYNTLNKQGNQFVWFYATWCGHCKEFIPGYETVKQKCKKANVLFQAVDCDQVPELAKFFQVSSYPSFYYVKKNSNTKVKFEVPRTVDNMVDFVLTQTANQ